MDDRNIGSSCQQQPEFLMRDLLLSRIKSNTFFSTRYSEHYPLISRIIIFVKNNQTDYHVFERIKIFHYNFLLYSRRCFNFWRTRISLEKKNDGNGSFRNMWKTGEKIEAIQPQNNFSDERKRNDKAPNRIRKRQQQRSEKHF